MGSTFSEKAFFLDAFVGMTVWLVVSEQADLSRESANCLGSTVRELVHRGARVWILHQASGAVETHLLSALEPWNGDWGRITLEKTREEALFDLWRQKRPLIAAGIHETESDLFLARVGELAVACRAGRVVVSHALGGIADGRGGAVSYISRRRLQHLCDQAGENLEPRRGSLRAIRAMLEGGVDAISLCRVAELDRELFTFDGSGTFFSPSHYCQVRPLGLDDFEEVESILQRGVREGYLLPRDGRHTLEVLISGYGAFVAGGRLAGVCALLTRPYQEEQAGEIVSLHTLTRFQGEGVAGRLLSRLKREARLRRLEYLFACTARETVANYFQSHGFQRIAGDSLPRAKWVDYDPERKSRVICLRWLAKRG